MPRTIDPKDGARETLRRRAAVSVKSASSAPRARTAKSGAIEQEAVATQQVEDDALISAWKERARADATTAFRAIVRANIEMVECGSGTPDGAAAGALLMFTSKGDTEDVATGLGFLLDPIIYDYWPPGSAASGSFDVMSAYINAFLAAYDAAAKDFRRAPTVGDFLGEVAPEEARWRRSLYASGLKGLANTPATSPPHAADKPRLVVFQYCVSLGIVSFKRSSGVKVILPGGSRFLAGLPYTLISICAGWWGIPWGPIWTLEAIGRNLRGGTDVTELVTSGGQPDRSAGLPAREKDSAAAAETFETNLAAGGEPPRGQDSATEAERAAVLAVALGQHSYEATWGKPSLPHLVKAYSMGIGDGVAVAQELYAGHPDRPREILNAALAGDDVVPEIFQMKLDRSDYVSSEQFIAACERYGGGYSVGFMALTLRRLAPSA